MFAAQKAERHVHVKGPEKFDTDIFKTETDFPIGQGSVGALFFPGVLVCIIGAESEGFIPVQFSEQRYFIQNPSVKMVA